MNLTLSNPITTGIPTDELAVLAELALLVNDEILTGIIELPAFATFTEWHPLTQKVLPGLLDIITANERIHLAVAGGLFDRIYNLDALDADAVFEAIADNAISIADARRGNVELIANPNELAKDYLAITQGLSDLQGLLETIDLKSDSISRLESDLTALDTLICVIASRTSNLQRYPSE